MQISTYVNNNHYILLKIAKMQNETISLKNILYYPTVTSNLEFNDYSSNESWRELWIKKNFIDEGKITNE